MQVPNGKILGQLPAKHGGEHFGMVFKKGNPLVALREPGARDAEGERDVEAIQATWLSKVVGAPVLK